jgi:hypothetical protein
MTGYHHRTGQVTWCTDTLKSIFLLVPLGLPPLKSEEKEPGNVPGYLPEYISG